MPNTKRGQIIVAAVAFLVVIAACCVLTLSPKDKATPAPPVQSTTVVPTETTPPKLHTPAATLTAAAKAARSTPIHTPEATLSAPANTTPALIYTPVVTLTPAAKGPLVTAKNNVNLREGPGTNYAVVGSLKGGESLEVVGRNSDSSWWQVSGDKGLAWVSAGVVAITGTVDGVGIVTSNAVPVTATTTPIPLPAFTVTPPQRVATVAPPRICCKYCGPNSKACGDSCISKDKNCKKGVGCACN